MQLSGIVQVRNNEVTIRILKACPILPHERKNISDLKYRNKSDKNGVNMTKSCILKYVYNVRGQFAVNSHAKSFALINGRELVGASIKFSQPKYLIFSHFLSFTLMYTTVNPKYISNINTRGLKEKLDLI
ncbi:hypothetical protein EGR_11082 [Echinococcus granulosus]|uniref:Uncharacterized protein n=1 Tax=Echinococcus granulosus TaxID=6210 RepID=W6UKP0_ECHGR|nr:hypothetical protein EGR_11082 [Echinococcus granulosus]EUB54059.1 hypothetical protein EGR_11082 [Echinococcus granulosus]